MNFGPIENADVKFGDFTVLVGPQACGKTVFLQLFKLLQDKAAIIQQLKAYNYLWKLNTTDLLNLYFGQGLSTVWKKNTQVCMDENVFTKASLIQNWQDEKANESIFLLLR